MKNGESIAHDILRKKVINSFTIKGFSCLEEIHTEGGTNSLDILAIKVENKRIIKIGIECETNPSLKKIIIKKEKFSKYVDKLYFAIPKNIELKENNLLKFDLDKDELFTINRIFCKSCLGVFFAERKAKFCPYCNFDKITCEFETKIENIFEGVSSSFKGKKNFILLKNPEVMKIISNGRRVKRNI